MRVAVDDNNAVVGFATYLIVDDIVELEDLFVDPRHMRQRIGASLVRDIATLVRDLGFVTLEVTANPHAQAFYRHMGFAVCHVVETQGYPADRMQRRTQ